MNSKKYESNYENCISDVVRKIIDAQDKVKQNKCDSGCEKSIMELLSQSNYKRNFNNTIPFFLTSRDNKPYIASGIIKAPIKGYPNESYFKCIETPILRAIKFNDNKNNCVVVELLRPVNANGIPVADRGEYLCDFFQEQTPYKTIQFRSTGVCTTIDLDCFCGITCLDPISPLSPYSGLDILKEHNNYEE
ncbi:hypothetical protein KGF86_16625 [Ornithinibacillus massiliensis]|uniref:Spore coat protein Z n=1 Tax=Ornithinibacillus massiliensis TaxID=1944633 RepID=A0ABS5MHK2_9BACI|nr:CotY/CotZ family spore coat protein [Ornithinibacillus massiliensis]MBS3681819.1 hypothetical protein [Ornithinibacillus massiliensis]